MKYILRLTSFKHQKKVKNN